jgi:hypothetical protein
MGPYAGLVSGAALIVDYMLTIAISIASALGTTTVYGDYGSSSNHGCVSFDAHGCEE